MGRLLPAVAIALFAATLADACSLCEGAMSSTQTLREEARQAKVVLFGTLTDARPTADGGTTDLRIENAIKANPLVAGKAAVTLPKYVPVDPKAPPKFLVFCDVSRNRLDPYRGFPVKSSAVVEYLKGALGLKADDPVAALKFFFDHLSDADPEVAKDAFFEWARANDRDVARAAKQLDPARVRALLRDPQTPDNRLSLYAFLLGGCGGAADADYLLGILRGPEGRMQRAYGGALAGYMQLRPEAGWALARETVADDAKPFPQRMAVLTTMRFLRAAQPDTARKDILRTLAAALPHGTIADLATEDLRRWEWWDLTKDVLAQFGKKSHASPMMRNAILRYAVSCPNREAKAFLAEVRKVDPETVKDIEQQVADEKVPVSGGR